MPSVSNFMMSERRDRRMSGVNQNYDYVPTVEGEEWRNEMLQALQKSAKPEPIRLACMKPVPNRPPYFAEEFHGRISREEVEELLTGKDNGSASNGRYLVRESNTFPGTYSLSLAYDGKINHYKLFYENGFYFTERSNDLTSKYSNIEELVGDIISLYRKLVQMQGQVELRKEKRSPSTTITTKPHNFQTHHYKHPKWCDLCGSFMWGLKAQGKKCSDCGLNVHNNCEKSVKGECIKAQLVKERKKIPDKRKTSTDSRTNYRESVISPWVFKTQCDYQESCVRFLNHLTLKTSLFDVEGINPCYCDNCCHDVDTPLCKSGDPPQTYSLPLGWSRFRLVSTENRQTHDVSNKWNVAFLSLHPEEVDYVLDVKLNPDDLNQHVPKPLIKFTPSIICADYDAARLRYVDQETKVNCAGQIVLQVYIEPFSYKVMMRPGGGEEIDPYFKKESIYWVTNQMASVVPFAILVKTIDATYLQM